MRRERLVCSVYEIAEVLNVSRMNVYERIRRGDIPSIHVGRAVRVPRNWLDDTVGTATYERDDEGEVAS